MYGFPQLVSSYVCVNMALKTRNSHRRKIGMYMPTLVVCQFRGKGPDVGASRVEVVGLSDPCLKLADEHLGLLVCNPAFAGGTGQLSDAVVPRLISATGHDKPCQISSRQHRSCKADAAGAMQKPILNSGEVKFPNAWALQPRGRMMRSAIPCLPWL